MFVRRLLACACASLVFAAALPPLVRGQNVSTEDDDSNRSRPFGSSPYLLPDGDYFPTEDAVRLAPSLPPAAREERVAEALRCDISVEADALPLDVLLRRIATQLEVNLVLDRAGIEECGASADTPVSWRLEGLPARTVLDLILDEHGLTWLVRDGVVLVTSRDKAESAYLETKVYDVADLVLRNNEFGEAVADFEPLISAITHTLQPQSWDEVGGPGSIIPFETTGVKALVVSQTFRLHEDIASLLKEIRAIRREADLLPERADLQPHASVRPTIPRRTLEADASRDAAVETGNRFGVDLYAALAAESDGNVFVSPPNIAALLATICAGAEGRTADELLTALRFSGAREELVAAYGALQRDSASPPRSPWTLHAANRLWIDRDLALRPDFATSMRSAFDAEPSVIDFTDPAAASRAINAWVSAETRGMITELLASSDLERGQDVGPAMVATSALYFEGRWVNTFDEALTSLAPFRAPGGTAQVWMMTQRAKLRYGVVDEAQIVELPYEGGALSFFAALPRESGDGLADLRRLEQKLSAGAAEKWLPQLSARKIDLFLPRFEIESSFELVEPLRQLGIQAAFSGFDADFSRMSDAKLWLQFVRHMAKIELNERGTRAAAATAGGFFGGSPPEVPVFRADRPFLFFIRDNRTGSILFLGRLVQPPAAAREG